jgi:hypothetical protein
MSCPYLTQVTMVFCRALPVHKLVPTDRITTAGPCEGDCFKSCPTFREALARAGHEIGQFESEVSHPATKKGAWS